MFAKLFQSTPYMMMEGAIGERLKSIGFEPDTEVALASSIYEIPSGLEMFYRQYLDIAEKYEVPLMITTPTRRANYERIQHSSYTESILRDNVMFLNELIKGYTVPIFVGGLMGCKGDAYKGSTSLSLEESIRFHSWQAEKLAEQQVDYLFAGIMPTLKEAVGIAEAMAATQLPYIISFMIRKDGCLLDGTPIAVAIETIDQKVDIVPLCYMTNCVHPDFVCEALEKPFNQVQSVKERFLGIQGNAAKLIPEIIESGKPISNTDPASWAKAMAKLHEVHHLKIFGGCCGTDEIYLDSMMKQITRKG